MITSKRWHHRARGFKLKTVRRRLCVQWHPVNYFISFFYKLKYWKFPYVDRAVNLLKKGSRLRIRRSNCNSRNRDKASSRNSLNSFYSDAISDCLEFIKLSADHSGNEHKLDCEELYLDAYDKFWRFDTEALPADLIRRGLAVEDPTAEHGLKLTIEDYPFANDGLILWDAIKEWVSDYVNHYNPDPALVVNDQELQAWWTEVRTKGHADKKDEPWWRVLKTPEILIHVLTTKIWVTAGHHEEVNFGQYMYGGYFPNRPTIARTNMPTEDSSDEFFHNFLKKPESALLMCSPSQIQATKVMAVLDVLSNHSPDEEYLGERIWSQLGLKILS